MPRLAILPSSGASDNNELLLVRHLHPRTKQKVLFGISRSFKLFECCQLNADEGHSMFYGNEVISDGSLTVMSAVDPVLLLIAAFDCVRVETRDKFIKLSDSLPDLHPKMCQLLTRKKTSDLVCDLLQLSSSEEEEEPMLRLNSDKVKEYLEQKFRKAYSQLDISVLAQLNTGTGKHQLILSMFAEYLSQEWYVKLKDWLGPAPDTLDNALGFQQLQQQIAIDYSRTANPESVKENGAGDNKKKPAAPLKKKNSVPPTNNSLITAFFKPKS